MYQGWGQRRQLAIRAQIEASPSVQSTRISPTAGGHVDLSRSSPAGEAQAAGDIRQREATNQSKLINQLILSQMISELVGHVLIGVPFGQEA